MARSPRLPEAPLDASPALRTQWNELVRILTQRLADDGAPYLTVAISGSVPTSVSLDRSAYSLTATTDTLALLLLSLEKAEIIKVRKS